MTGWEFEQVAGPFGGPTDGPVWDGGGLLFSVVPESWILRYDPSSGEIGEFRRYTARTRGLAVDAHGDVYGCQAITRLVVRFNRDGSTSPLATRLDGELHNFPDDLTIDRQGRVWFSDPNEVEPGSGPQWPPLEHASVLRQERRPDRTWTIRRMTYDTTAPRGVLLSPDERTLYVSDDSPEEQGKRELRAYPVKENGALGPYAVLHTFGADHRGVHRGIDGMCRDANGNILACAGWHQSGPGPMIYVFSPTGAILETHATPFDQPTNCAFGDGDLGTLYITSTEGYLHRVRLTGRRGAARPAAAA